MIMDEQEFFRFMFWYCGDSKQTIEDALNQWNKYHSYDDEKIKEYDDFHNQLKVEKKINHERTNNN